MIYLFTPTHTKIGNKIPNTYLYVRTAIQYTMNKRTLKNHKNTLKQTSRNISWRLFIKSNENKDTIFNNVP